MNTKTATPVLAPIFDKIEVGAKALDEVAGGILTAIKDAKADTLDLFNAMVTEAYEAKGWSQRVGPPMPGDVSAPASVKTYLSTIRGAYREGVKLLDMTTISQVRKALRTAKASKAANAPEPEAPAPELKGVTVQKAGHLTGSLWHDAIVLWENLPTAQQTALEEAVRKLVAKYTRKAPPVLRLAA